MCKLTPTSRAGSRDVFITGRQMRGKRGVCVCTNTVYFSRVAIISHALLQGYFEFHVLVAWKRSVVSRDSEKPAVPLNRTVLSVACSVAPRPGGECIIKFIYTDRRNTTSTNIWSRVVVVCTRERPAALRQGRDDRSMII